MTSMAGGGMGGSGPSIIGGNEVVVDALVVHDRIMSPSSAVAGFGTEYPEYTIDVDGMIRLQNQTTLPYSKSLALYCTGGNQLWWQNQKISTGGSGGGSHATDIKITNQTGEADYYLTFVSGVGEEKDVYVNNVDNKFKLAIDSGGDLTLTCETFDGDLTGNASSATALTSGDKTITGALSVTKTEGTGAVLTLKGAAGGLSQLRFEGNDGGAMGEIQGVAGSDLIYSTPSGTNLRLSATADLIFYTGNPTPAERMRILATGEIGVGKADPSYALDVDGDARATNFRGALVGNVTGDLTGDVTGDVLGVLTIPALDGDSREIKIQPSTNGTSLWFSAGSSDTGPTGSIALLKNGTGVGGLIYSYSDLFKWYSLTAPQAERLRLDSALQCYVPAQFNGGVTGNLTVTGGNVIGNVTIPANDGSSQTLGVAGSANGTDLVLAGGNPTSPAGNAGNIELKKDGKMYIDGDEIYLRPADGSGGGAVIIDPTNARIGVGCDPAMGLDIQGTNGRVIYAPNPNVGQPVFSLVGAGSGRAQLNFYDDAYGYKGAIQGAAGGALTFSSGGGTSLSLSSALAMTFLVNGTQWMTLSTSGLLSVTGSTAVAGVGPWFGNSTNEYARLDPAPLTCDDLGVNITYIDVMFKDASGAWWMGDYADATRNCGISVTYGVSAEFYQCNSDKRAKHQISDLPSEWAMEQLMALRPVSFVWKDPRSNDGRRTCGFLAQDIAEHCNIPGAVYKTKQLLHDGDYKSFTFVSFHTSCVYGDFARLRSRNGPHHVKNGALKCDDTIELAITDLDVEHFTVKNYNDNDGTLDVRCSQAQADKMKQSDLIRMIGHEVDDYHQLDHDTLIPVIVKAMQELSQELAEVKAELQALKATKESAQ